MNDTIVPRHTEAIRRTCCKFRARARPVRSGKWLKLHCTTDADQRRGLSAPSTANKAKEFAIVYAAGRGRSSYLIEIHVVMMVMVMTGKLWRRRARYFDHHGFGGDEEARH